MKKIVYSIQGNIGSGKSTLLQLLSKQIPQLDIAPEPIHDWCHVSTHNLFHYYYQQPERWSYTFQNYAVMTRMSQLFKVIKGQSDKQKILFSERCVVGDKQIFAKLMHQSGKMNQMEYQLYLKVFDDLQKLYHIPIEYRHIYLRTEPKNCYTRIVKRGRQQEKSVTLPYLQKVHNLHEKWLQNAMMVQGDSQFETNNEQLAKIVNKIKDWLFVNK